MALPPDDAKLDNISKYLFLLTLHSRLTFLRASSGLFRSSLSLPLRAFEKVIEEENNWNYFEPGTRKIKRLSVVDVSLAHREQRNAQGDLRFLE